MKYLFALFLFFGVAQAAEMATATHILAVRFFNMPDTTAAMQFAPFQSGEDCRAAALKMNQTDETLRRPDLRAKGAEFVCLKIERVGA